MKTLIKVALLVCISLSAQAQSIHWAFKVLDKSSEKSNRDYSANQVLGYPNVYPTSGSNTLAWEPSGKGKEEFIKVGFVRPIKARKLVVVETNNPAQITHAYVYDASGAELEVRLPNQTDPGKTRITEINTVDIDFYVYAAKIVFAASDKAIGIDAIAVSESEQPVVIKRDENFAIKSSMTITRLDTTVNSPYTELGPIMSPDGKTLYFSRRNDPKNVGGKDDLEDIWYSKWDEKHKKWEKATNIGAPLNNKYPNFINSITPDGNTVLLGNSYSSEGSFIDDGVSISHRTETGWSDPEQLVIEDDYNDSENADYYLSNSQKILLMAIQRKNDTKGGLDIYVSFLKDDKTWTKPKNLGADVNTNGDEAYMFLASDDKTMYFSSTGLNGFGGSDIYVSRRLDDSWQKWSKPENLGQRVNTPADETYFTISAAGDKAFFTSSGRGKDDQDMFSIDLPAKLQPTAVALISGKVYNSKTKAVAPNVTIYFEDLETGNQVGIAKSSPTTGAYQIVLPSGANYGYLATSPGFLSVSANLDLKDQKKYTEKTIDLYLTPAEIGERIVINNIFFDFDKSELKKESFSELNRLAKLLSDSKTMEIEIGGYTDNVGSESYNDALSQKRAESVAAYITKQANVDKSRIVLKHYGELHPIADNKSKQGRQQNRRVEFKILKQ